MAKKNISARQKRMHGYAKNGGLMGYTNGGDVLPQAQLGVAVREIAKSVAKNAKKVIPKIKKIYTDYKGTTYDPELLKNTGYARKVDLEQGVKHRKQGTGSN